MSGINRFKNSQVIIIDDDPEIQTLLRKLFTIENYQVQIFQSALDALEMLEYQFKNNSKNSEEICDLIVCDLNLPDLDGLGFIEKLNEKRWKIPVILVTAHASVETAVTALKNGAFDYVVKPIHLTELSIVASRAIQHRKLETENATLQSQLNNQLKDPLGGSGKMIGKSPAMRQVIDLIERVATSASNVLITGESGAGKEVVARSIHQQSDRQNGPFIPINCSAIPDQLLESELFGHRKGAFTGAHENREGLFEEAKGGTVFLDEIGDMPLALQAKLLRVLQERKVKPIGENQLRDIDIRIISATHKNVRQMIQEGKFREDLYYRICVIPIHVPPLRERKEDIPFLADFFLKKYGIQNSSKPKKLTQAGLAKLYCLSWPGNVRELENTLERAIVLSHGETIDDKDIYVDKDMNTDKDLSAEKLNSSHSSLDLSKMLTLQELERQYIHHVLTATQNAKEQAAEILGINRKTLYRKELEYGLNKI